MSISPDDFTITDTFDEPGRWYAVIADKHGHVESFGNAFYDDETDVDDWRIVVVKDTANPVREDDDWRLPGSYNSDDMAHEFDSFWDARNFEQEWLDANAIARSRNQRAEADKVFNAVMDSEVTR